MERRRYPRSPHEHVCPSDEAPRSAVDSEVGCLAHVKGFCARGEGMAFLSCLRWKPTQIPYFQLVTSLDGGKRSKPEDNIAMLEQLRAVDPLAASSFLEHLILEKRSDVRTDSRVLPSAKRLPPGLQDRRLHVEFAGLCLDQLLGYVADEAISRLWRAKGKNPNSSTPHSANLRLVSGYQKSTTQNSFLSYFVSTTPDSEHKRVRLKANLFLQASALLDLGAILSRLKKHPSILSWEIALIEGKVLIIYIHPTRRAE